jgi:hypothetical protein
VRVRILLGVALALTVAALLVTLSQRAPRLSGTNFTHFTRPQVTIPPGGESCQQHTYLPAGTAVAQVLVATEGRLRPSVSLRFHDLATGLTFIGRAAAGREGMVNVPLERVVRAEQTNATACVRNTGHAKIVVAGDDARPALAARVNGRRVRGLIAFRYLRTGRESWWSLAPTVARRFGLGKAGIFGTWTLWALVALLLGLWVAVVRLLARELS